MTISLKSDAGGTFGEILVNGSQVAKFTPGGNAVIPGAKGTVSQSGGIPTGAIIERGGNANGDYTRFSDGTQICEVSVTMPLWAAGASSSAVWTFPAAFSASPRVVDIIVTINPHLFNASAVVASATTADLYAGGSVSASGAIFAFAIGRWY